MKLPKTDFFELRTKQGHTVKKENKNNVAVESFDVCKDGDVNRTRTIISFFGDSLRKIFNNVQLKRYAYLRSREA